MPSLSPARGPVALRFGSVVVDAVLALALFGTTVVMLSHGGLKALRAGSDGAPVDLDVLTVALAAGSTLPLAAARRWPLAVFVATAASSVALAAHGADHDLALGAAVGLYLLTSQRDPACEPAVGPTTTTIVALTAGSLLAYVVAAAVAQRTFPWPELLHTSLTWSAAWFAGERTRLRHAHIVELHDRAVRAEREAEGERRLATAEERARIARDLHDSAGHAINVIAVRAGAARLRHRREPDRSLQALEAIEELARQTAADIDHIVGNLRDAAPAGGTDGTESATVEAPPGLASLDTLVARHAAAGLEVAVEASGPVRPLSAPADQAAYRILQEALTNAARHGAGRTLVGVAYGDRAVELTVTNPVDPGTAGAGAGAGPGADGSPGAGAGVDAAARPGGGHGLVGMRERASLLGGDLDASRVNGTFRVRARIPYAGPVGP